MRSRVKGLGFRVWAVGFRGAEGRHKETYLVFNEGPRAREREGESERERVCVREREREGGRE